MAKDTIVLSPELSNVGRREAVATEAMPVGTLAVYTAAGVALVAEGEKPSLNLVVVENVSAAEPIDYTYLTGENVKLQSLPKGALVNLLATQGTFNPADEVEINDDGAIIPLASGDAVGTVWIKGGQVIGAEGGFVAVELY